MKDIELFKTLYAQGHIGRRDFMKQMAAWGITAGAATTMLSGVVMAQEPQRGGHLVISGAGSSTDGADPVTYDSFFNSYLGSSFGNRLVRIGEGGAVVPRLATSWDVSDDLKTWVLQLREGVEFHNGKTLTAADVVYSLKRHYGEDSTSGVAGNLTSVEDVVASGTNEVTISLSEGNLDFINVMSDYHLVIQPEGSTDDGIGTGAFVLESLEPGVRATFSRNPNYWNGDKPYYDSMEILIINDDTARTAALQTGKVHIIDRLPLTEIDFLQLSSNINIISTPSRGHYNMIARTDTNPFDNADVMLALKYALPRQQIIDQVMAGFGGIGNDHPINGGFGLFEDAVEQRPFDLEQAAFHYKKSGHSGPIVIESSQASWPGATDGALVFKEAAAQAGINLEVKRVPADGYWSDVWNVRPFCTSYWIPRATQDQILTVQFTGPWNETVFENDRFAELLPQARLEKNADMRAAMYTEMQQLIHDNSGALVPVFNPFIDAMSTEIQGFKGSASNAQADQLIQEFTWFG